MPAMAHPAVWLALATVLGCSSATGKPSAGSSAAVPLVGRDVHETPVDAKTYAAAKKANLAPLTFTPDPQATLKGDELSFGVVVENRSGAPADAYWTVSRARPGSQALDMTLSAPDFEIARGPGEVEIYDFIGQVAMSKVVVPAGGSVRFERTRSLKEATYVGAPEAELFWSIELNEKRQEGKVKVTLPRRESLHVAARFGNLAEVKRMLAADADINAKDKGGQTALEVACWNRRNSVVAALLERGADPTQCLRAVASGSDVELAKLVLAHGGKVNEPDDNDQTPLNWALGRIPRDQNMMRFLIENGADIYAKGKNGSTPYDYGTPEDKAFMKSVAKKK
jgi:hypothetical protein